MSRNDLLVEKCGAARYARQSTGFASRLSLKALHEHTRAQCSEFVDPRIWGEQALQLHRQHKPKAAVGEEAVAGSKGKTSTASNFKSREVVATTPQDTMILIVLQAGHAKCMYTGVTHILK